MDDHVQNWQSRQNRVSEEPTLVVLSRPESYGHARQFRQSTRLVDTTRSFHPDVHFLERHQIGFRLIDHGRQPLQIILSVRALPVVNVVAQDTQACRFRGKGSRIACSYRQTRGK